VPTSSTGLSHFWKGVLKALDPFLNHSSVILGNGEFTSFWKDKWCRDQPSKSIIPSLFELAWNKASNMVDNGYWSNGQWIR
jgi:hypothetical protein